MPITTQPDKYPSEEDRPLYVDEILSLMRVIADNVETVRLSLPQNPAIPVSKKYTRNRPDNGGTLYNMVLEEMQKDENLNATFAVKQRVLSRWPEANPESINGAMSRLAKRGLLMRLSSSFYCLTAHKEKWGK